LITTFVSEPELPAGLTLDEVTGEITGIPTDIQDSAIYTITGTNPSGATLTIISISIREGICETDDLFETTTVGNIVTVECSLRGSYIGSQQRECKLGETDGEWQEITGTCISVVLIAVLIIVVVLIICIIIFIIVRSAKKSKKGSKENSKKASLKKQKSSSKSGVTI
jgi:large-conductance mechanosensitive channel